MHSALWNPRTAALNLSRCLVLKQGVIKNSTVARPCNSHCESEAELSSQAVANIVFEFPGWPRFQNLELKVLLKAITQILQFIFHPRVFWDFFKFKSNISNWTEACWTVEHLPPRHWHLWQPVQHLGSEGCRAMLIPLSMGLLSIGVSKPLLIGLMTMPWC